jgi:hypothetical protein
MAGTFGRLAHFGLLLVISVITRPLAAQPVFVPQVQQVPLVITAFSAEDIRDVRKRNRADARWCARAQQYRRNLEKFYTYPKVDFDQLGRVAYQLFDGLAGCRKDQTLAVEIMERLVGPDPLRGAKSDDLGLLIRFHERIGTSNSFARAKILKRLAWLRDDYRVFQGTNWDLGWTTEERRAFIASDPIWSFISGSRGSTAGSLYENTLIDPLSPRHDPVKFLALVDSDPNHSGAIIAARLLLDGTQLPRDPTRAEALLLPLAQYDDTARVLIFPLIASRLESTEKSVRDEAIKQFKAWSSDSGPGSAAMRTRIVPIIAKGLSSNKPSDQQEAVRNLTDFTKRGTTEAEGALLPWLERALRRGNAAQKADAWGSASSLSLVGNLGARKLLEADMVRTYGTVDGGQLTLESGNLAHIMTADDYPPSAQRNEEAGIVEASVIIAPNGRIVGGVVTHSATPALDAEVLKAFGRRARQLNFPAFPGRYVKAKLPPVQFKLNPCNMPSASKIETPAGALIVEAQCRSEIIQDVPIPVQVISSAVKPIIGVSKGRKPG